MLTVHRLNGKGLTFSGIHGDNQIVQVHFGLESRYR